MNETLRSWIISLTGAGMLTAAANALTPKGKVKNIVRLLCGVVMGLTLLKPFVGFDFTTLSGSLAKYRAESDGINTAILETNDRLAALIIEGRCRAYILDKAQEYGLDTVEVTVVVKRGDEGTWYPYETNLTVNGQEQNKVRLSEAIESELGISRDRQHWRNIDEDC